MKLKPVRTALVERQDPVTGAYQRFLVFENPDRPDTLTVANVSTLLSTN